MIPGKEQTVARILVVDDDPDIVETIRTYLEKDYEVSTADRAFEAFALFLKQCPDIILLDIKMPGLDGIEFAKKVREVNEYVIIIIITGHGDRDNAVEAIKFGATDFMYKPVDMERLRGAIERALAKRGTRNFRSQRS